MRAGSPPSAPPSGSAGASRAWLVPERLELRLRVALELQELRA